MNLPLFLSKHIYASQDGKQQVSRPAVRIATISVSIGLAIMLISVSVVLGFKHTIRDKVVGFGSHIQVAEFTTLQMADNKPIEMESHMMSAIGHISGVDHVQRYTLTQGILKTDRDFLGVAFKGIGQEYDTTFLHKNLIQGAIPQYSDSVGSNAIVISKSMADKLQLSCGQRVFAYFINQDGVRTRRFNIAGIYQTNLSQYDKNICFVDIYTAGKLNSWERDQVTGAEVTIKDFSQLDNVEKDFVKKINRATDKYGSTYTSKTIKDINPQIFSWLDLLDLNVWIILAIMTAVACVTIVSGLLIIILERTTMIGILKALGARNKTIRHTFIWLASYIIGKGLLYGNILGIGLIILQKYTGLVKLDPSTYYVDYVPTEVNIPLFLILNVATMIICLAVLIIPSFFISHVHPAKSMRYE